MLPFEARKRKPLLSSAALFAGGVGGGRKRTEGPTANVSGDARLAIAPYICASDFAMYRRCVQICSTQSS